MVLSAHRLGLIVASGATVLFIGGAVALSGAAAPAGPLKADAAASVAPSVDPTGAIPTQTIYVRPAPPAAIINVRQADPTLPPKVVHLVVPGTGGEQENEGTGDD